MSQKNTFKFVIVGAGPSALSVLDHLLKSMVSEDEIAIISPNISAAVAKSDLSKIEHKQTRNPIDLAIKLRKKNGLNKMGKNVTDLNNKIESLASYWGASHLPPIFEGREYEKYFSKKIIHDAISDNAKMLRIQAQASSKFQKEFPNHGEELNKLTRKKIAEKWAINHSTNFIHSRLSLGGHRFQNESSCTLSGYCFTGCPSGAFWSPEYELQNLMLKHPKINLFTNLAIRFNLKNKIIYLEDEREIQFQNLFVSAGPSNSLEIIKNSNVTNNEINMKYSPVVVAPFLTRKIPFADYAETFVVADLLLPSFDDEKLKSLTQVYFPTPDLTANILTKMPILIFLLLKSLPNKAIQYIFTKIGVTMTFGESTSWGDQQKKSIVSELKNEQNKLKIHFKIVGGKILSLFNLYILDGSSYHTGSLHFTNHKNESGLDCELVNLLRKNGVYLTDGLSLVRLPPGPHSNTVGIVARCLVSEAISR